MVMRNGDKYACDSCIRGHRVSGCHHTDRELHFIAPKGRPVKQCEHCRGARKSKSHHAKCDCGGKKERGEIKLEDKDCCCNLGDSCTCGGRNSIDLHAEASGSKSSHQRPHASKNMSDGHLTTYINSKHKACHKWDAAQSHGPYPRPKLNAASCHSSSPSITGTHTPNAEMMIMPHRGTRDDSHIVPVASDRFSNPAAQSMDNLPLSYFDNNLFNMSGNMDSMPSNPFEAVTPESQDNLYTIPSNESVSASFIEGLIANANAAPSSVQGRSTLYRNTQDDFFDAEKASFGSNDLPLNNGTLTPDFPQPTSFTDDSNMYSAPGLTAASSTAPSELGDTMVLTEPAMDSPFDANSSFPPFDLQTLSAFDPNATAPSQQMPPPPTSNPSPQATRRSLDAQAMKSLSTFPAFDTGSQAFLSIPQDTSGLLDSLSSSVPNNAAKPSFLRPQSFNPSTTFATDRPRSVTTPTVYNPTTMVDAMYPRLDQDFADAANWDPSAIAWNMPTFMPPAQ